MIVAWLLGREDLGMYVHLSHHTSPFNTSPIFPPLLRYVTFKSVDTPVANSPREATANEPLASTMLAIVPPCTIPSRFVWCLAMVREKVTRPGLAEWIVICE